MDFLYYSKKKAPAGKSFDFDETILASLLSLIFYAFFDATHKIVQQMTLTNETNFGFCVRWPPLVFLCSDLQGQENLVVLLVFFHALRLSTKSIVPFYAQNWPDIHWWGTSENAILRLKIQCSSTHTHLFQGVLPDIP